MAILIIIARFLPSLSQFAFLKYQIHFLACSLYYYTAKFINYLVVSVTGVNLQVEAIQNLYWTTPHFSFTCSYCTLANWNQVIKTSDIKLKTKNKNKKHFLYGMTTLDKAPKTWNHKNWSGQLLQMVTEGCATSWIGNPANSTASFQSFTWM